MRTGAATAGAATAGAASLRENAKAMRMSASSGWQPLMRNLGGAEWAEETGGEVRYAAPARTKARPGMAVDPGASKNVSLVSGVTATRTRSEERRVGKECRSRWSPY